MKFALKLCLCILVFFESQVLASNGSNDAIIKENYEDIIAKAQTLVLQRDRDKAMQVLRFSVKNEKPSTARKLVEQMDRIGEMFFTEKGQQVFEMAEALLSNNASMAIDSYKEVAKIEDKNLQVNVQLAKAYLMTANCDDAIKTLQENLEVHPWHHRSIFILSQAAVCKSSPMNIEASQTKFLENSFIQTYLETAQSFLQKEAKNKLQIELAIKKFPDFPDFYYFLSQIDGIPAEELEEANKKYAALCSKPASSLLTNKDLVWFCKNQELK